MPVSPRIKSQLEEKLRPLITKLQEQSDEDQESGARPLIALQLKEAVAALLHCWIVDPVEGFVLRKEHVVNGMRLDDLVATPAGAGYLRGYRREDGFCTVVYPWGQGFVHVKDVEKVQQALEKHLKKRTYNEYIALEHQQLYEQIEGLLDNLPSPASDDTDLVKKEASIAAIEEGERGIEEYKELLKSLEEEHVDTTVLREDLGFLRRVQALVNKVKELRRLHIPQEPEQKLPRTDGHDTSPEVGQEGCDEPMQKMEQTEEQHQQEQEQEHELTEKEKGTVLNEKTETETEKQ